MGVKFPERAYNAFSGAYGCPALASVTIHGNYPSKPRQYARGPRGTAMRALQSGAVHDIELPLQTLPQTTRNR